MYNSMAQSRFQQPNKRSQYTSTQIYQQIKKKPFTQLINGIEYTYSILCKKRQTFLFGNDRFLYLKGIQSISYARQLAPNKKLPFIHTAQLPQAKATFALEDIQNFTNHQEQFIINFSGDKKLRWEFVCPNKHCALEWKNRLEQAMHRLNQFKMSGFSNKDELINRNKSITNHTTQHNHLGSMIGTGFHSNFISDYNQFNNSRSRVQYPPPYSNQQPFPFMNSNPNSEIPNNSFINKAPIQNESVNKDFNIVVMNENNKPIPLTQQSKKPQQPQWNTPLHTYQEQHPKKVQHLSTPKRLFPSKSKKTLQANQQETNSPKSPNRPNVVLFRGSSIAKVDNFIIEDAHQHSSESQQEVSNISPSQKLRIKKEIIRLQRNWVDQLIENKEEVALILNFKNYIQKIAEVLVNELPKDNSSRIFPSQQVNKQYALYKLEDVQIQIYFYSQQHLIQKNKQYKKRVIEFKNYDYLIGATHNEGMLIVPLMVLFQFKGFLGMAKNRVISSRQYCNKQVYSMMDRQQFESETKIKAEVLLNEQHCNIVAVQSKNELAFNSSNVVYFVDKLTQFLPIQQKSNSSRLLRPELVQDQQLDSKPFGDQQNPNKTNEVINLINKKVDSFITCLQTQSQYFTNSKQLSQLIHFFGLNIRHIGLIYKKAKQNWLRNLIKADVIARSLKNYYRYDIQNVAQIDLNKNLWERQQERQAKRVISFLNIVFGNTETTFRMWRNVNSYTQYAYNIKIWENQYTDVSIPYLLLALQNHLKIVLSNDILARTCFKSMQSFQVKDFIRFQFDATVYNLDYTDLFEDIHDCLEEQNFDSFHTLCEILTKEANPNTTYFQLLKNHSINDLIRQFLLQFTSPQDNYQLYSRIESKNHPSKLIYQSKLAEIRWYFKAQKYQHIQAPVNFIEDHAKKWLGNVHPILTHLYRTLAEFYSQQQVHYSKALKYATSSLENQQALFNGDCQYLWKDYFLIGKIHFVNNRFMQGIKFLFKAKELVNMQSLNDYQVYSQMSLMLSKSYLALKYFKQSYTAVRELYKLIRDQRDQRSLILIIESVSLIKQLLQINQEHQSYQRFIQNDFSEIVYAFGEYPSLMSASIKMIALPNLKKVMLRSNKNRAKLLNIIDQISKIPQQSNSCQAYFRVQIKEGSFPKNYLQQLKEIDSVLEQMEVNHMMQRWKSFNKMTNQSILDKITGSIHRGFQFLANVTALFNYLGQQALAQLFIMEK